MKRAYSLLTVKALDDQARTITGLASTPTVDRMGDSVDPMGAKFKTPMPLLMYHDSELPVGTVNFAKPNKSGIPFTATIPNVVEPGVIQDRVNEAWHSIKYGLIAAVSIGFRIIDDAYEQMKDGGYLFREWEWLELSLCAIPANPDAVIQSFKSMDPDAIRSALSIKQTRAASGNRGPVRLIVPGVSGTNGVKGVPLIKR
jgi:HK97 family phage prohead protease